MVNVAKDVLKDKVRRQILHDLLLLLAGTRSERGGDLRASAWVELVSETEQLELAKRLAIVLLLGRNVPYDAVQTTLKVSSATVAKHDRLRADGAYDAIERLARAQGRVVDVDGLLERILANGLPRYAERHRLKWYREHWGSPF